MRYLINTNTSHKLLFVCLLLCTLTCGFSGAVYAEGLPALNISLGGSGDSTGDVVQSMQLLVLLTVLALAPSILVLMTSFTRIVIVLGFTRNALGTQNMPPNQVVTGLALILTFFLMSPVLGTVYNDAWLPYSNGDIELT